MSSITVPVTPAFGQHARNGSRYDRRLTAMMMEDMLFDPILAAKVILGIKIPPHEELRILQMWTTHLTLDDSGFSTGKSFTYAIVAALRCVLIPNRTCGILSGTFRQGKLIFRNFDRWHSQSKIFRHCVKVGQGKPRLVHGAEAWEMFTRGNSTCRVLPPNLLQDAERLRSERWTDGFFDEWTTFGNFKAFTSTILGRVTAANEYGSCPVRQNHVHLSSTPQFTHHPAYKIVQAIQANIAAGNPDYARMTFNFRHIPKTKKWEHLVNRKVIFSMQTMNPPGVVKTEIDGEWTADSVSYYLASVLESDSLRRAEVKVHLKRHKAGDTYIGAFDTARGRQGSQRAGGDDFAFSVLRIPQGSKHAEFCCCVRKNNINAENMAGIIHELHSNFGFGMILYDPAGGGMFVKDELKKPEAWIRGKLTGVTPLLEMGDLSGVIGEIILVPIRRSTFQIQRLLGKVKSDSVLVNYIHRNMRQLLETHNQFFVPPPWTGWENLEVNSSKYELDRMRLRLMEATGLSDLERAKAEIDLAIRQLVSVDVARDGNNDPIVDTHGMYKFQSKSKKDSAYSTVYAALGKAIWDQMGLDGTSADDEESVGYFATGPLIPTRM